jgi:hypothetical protein
LHSLAHFNRLRGAPHYTHPYMSYRNKTYVIFDGELDQWAYRYMKGWRVSEHIDFDFYNAHDLHSLTPLASSPEYIRRQLRQGFSGSKQAIVLIGENTRHKHRFVRWEMEVALTLDLPIIAVNLNGQRECDEDLCPPIIRDEYVVHVPFKAKIIQYALDNFPIESIRREPEDRGPRYYSDAIYRKLGL